MIIFNKIYIQIIDKHQQNKLGKTVQFNKNYAEIQLYKFKTKMI